MQLITCTVADTEIKSMKKDQYQNKTQNLAGSSLYHQQAKWEFAGEHSNI